MQGRGRYDGIRRSHVWVRQVPCVFSVWNVFSIWNVFSMERVPQDIQHTHTHMYTHTHTQVRCVSVVAGGSVHVR
jgi:hypothetical protein